MSLPSSPLTPGSSPSASALPPHSAGAHQPHVPPPHTHAQQQQYLQAPAMQARKSLPGASAPSPAAGSKRPPHPLAQGPLPRVPDAHPLLMSDRPDSDSEDSDAEVVVVAKPPAQKTPRVPPGAAAPGQGAGAGAQGPAGGAPQKAPRKAMPPGRKAVARGTLRCRFLAAR